MLTRKAKPQDLFDNLKGMVIRPGSSNKHWVNSLFHHMQKDSISTFTLRKSKGIPPLPPAFEQDLHEGELDFDKIINRLKIRSGLDPVTYKEARECSFPQKIHGKDYMVRITFNDTTDDPSCEIQLHEE